MKAKLLGFGSQKSVIVQMDYYAAKVIFGCVLSDTHCAGNIVDIPVDITMGPIYKKRIEKIQQAFAEIGHNP